MRRAGGRRVSPGDPGQCGDRRPRCPACRFRSRNPDNHVASLPGPLAGRSPGKIDPPSVEVCRYARKTDGRDVFRAWVHPSGSSTVSIPVSTAEVKIIELGFDAKGNFTRQWIQRVSSGFVKVTLSPTRLCIEER